MKKREYVITDGSRYIMQDSSGKYKLTSSSVLAEVFDEVKTADAILNNAVPKAQRTHLFVGFYENGILSHCSLSEHEKKERRDKVTAKETIKDKTFKLTEYSFEEDQDIQSLVCGFAEVKASLEKSVGLYRKLEEELLRVDYMLEDIKHYRGTKRLNARDGYKLNNLDQDLFLRRVSIKNQMEVVKKLEKHYTDIFEKIDDICNTISKVRNQTYKPRILVNLFENNDFSII